MLAARGLATEGDPGDGALPSGRSLLADAALLLSSLTGDDAHRRIAEAAVAPALAYAADQPSAFGAALAVASRLAEPLEQLVIVAPDGAGELGRGVARLAARRARDRHARAGGGVRGRRVRAVRRHAARATGCATAYYCEHFVCALPVTTATS